MHMEKTFTKKRNILIISLICTALWGSAFPALKISYERLALEITDIYSRIYLAGIRFFLASVLVFLYGKFIFKVDISVRKESIKPIILLGLLQTSLQYFFFYIGIANTTGIRSAIIQASSTFFVVNMSKCFDLKFEYIGEGFLQIYALVSAIATIYVEDISGRINSILLTGGQMFSVSLLLLLVGKIGMKGSNLIFDGLSLLLLL